MKKTLTKSIIIAWIVLGCFSPAALAQTTTTKAASVLPTNIDMFFESDTAVENPLWDLVSAQMEGAPDVAVLLFEMAANNVITFALGNFEAGESDYDFYLSVNTDEAGFTKFVETSDAEISEVYGDKTIYKMEEDAFAALLGNLMLVTNKIENLRVAITNFNKPGNSLADNATFKAVTIRNLGGSFLNIYINPAVIMEQVTSELGLTSELGVNATFTGLMNALTGEGVSVSKVSDGFKFAIAVKADKTKLAAINMTMDKYNFTPSLYKLVSGKGLIFYQERSNIKAQMDDAIKMFNFDAAALAELNSFKVDFKTETGIDFDRELLPLLTKNYLVTLHDAGQMLPGVTMVLDVSDHTALAGQMMVKVSEYLKKSLQKAEDDAGTDLFTSGLYDAGGTAFYEYAINLKKIDGGSDLESFSDDDATVYLRLAVTSDGNLVISTVKDLAGVFRSSEGLMSDAALKAEFTNPSAIINEVAYLNIDNIAAYVNHLMTMSGADSGSIDTAAALFKPWHGLFMRSYAEADSVSVEGKLNIDLAAMGDYATYIENLFGSAFGTNYGDYSRELPDLGQLGFGNSFCDVSSNDWYYPYVTDLSDQMIVSGYEDGCFKPNQPVTRAEFMKMAMKALGKAAAINSSYQPFKDVPPIYDAWYSEDINMADMLGYVDGYSDGTFHPNALITRAEAVQILYNMSNQLPSVNVIYQPLESLISFNDVHKTDWFFTPVVAAYHYNLVKGATPTTFEPNRNITRAEAAKIINLLQTLELQALPPAEGEYVGPE